MPLNIVPLIVLQHVSGAGEGHALQTTASPISKSVIKPSLTSSERYNPCFYEEKLAPDNYYSTSFF